MLLKDSLEVSELCWYVVVKQASLCKRQMRELAKELKEEAVFIPDPPKTTTMINQPTSEEEGNNRDDMKLEPRSASFVSNQPSRLSQQQQREQQQPQQQVYPYSVKIEQSSSGAAKVSVHTYNVNPNAAKDEAVRLFIETREELKSKGLKVLEQQQNDQG